MLKCVNVLTRTVDGDMLQLRYAKTCLSRTFVLSHIVVISNCLQGPLFHDPCRAQIYNSLVLELMENTRVSS